MNYLPPIQRANNVVGGQQRLVWTPEKAQRAAERGVYIVVPSGTRRFLRGANRSWNLPREANIIFHSRYRIAGQPEDVIQALRQAGVDENTIQQVIQTSFNAQNVQGEMAVQFAQALAQDEGQNAARRDEMAGREAQLERPRTYDKVRAKDKIYIQLMRVLRRGVFENNQEFGLERNAFDHRADVQVHRANMTARREILQELGVLLTANSTLLNDLEVELGIAQPMIPDVDYDSDDE